MIQRDPPPRLLRAQELIAMGSLSSPICAGSPRQAAGALLRALWSILGDLGAAFEEDVQRQCRVVAAQASSEKITAQLLQKIPGDAASGYARSAEEIHIDIDPRTPDAAGMRLVRSYFGANTQWLPAADEPLSLQRLRHAPLTERTLSRYREIMDALQKQPPALRQVPQNHTILYQGGLREGLVHRAPPCLHPRLILVVSARRPE